MSQYVDQPPMLETSPTRWRALFAGHVIADSDAALILREPGLPPRVYFPKEDVEMEYMGRSDASAGPGATLFTLLMDGHFAENAVRVCDQPPEGLEALADHAAFITDQVEVYAVDDAAVNPHPRAAEGLSPAAPVNETILHTDSGAGVAQRPHWEPNVTEGGPDEDFADGGVR